MHAPKETSTNAEEFTGIGHSTYGDKVAEEITSEGSHVCIACRESRTCGIHLSKKVKHVFLHVR
jgi:hypothetical protein